MLPDDGAERPVPPRALAESRRNELLRRTDWRFLLPDPHPSTVACAAGGELAAACGLFSERVISASEATPGSCDLLVCENPDQAALEHGREVLRSGGFLYVEWSPAKGSAGAMSARILLRDAGFDVAHVLRPWPSVDCAQGWMPLEDSGASAYVVRLVTRNTPGRRARLRAAVRGLLPGGSAPSVLCAIARRGTGTGEQQSGVEPFWANAARQAWPDAAASPTERSAPRVALVTGGPRSVSKVIALLFARGAPAPGLIVKLPRVSESNAGLRREASALAEAGGRLPGIPRLVFRVEHGGITALGEEAIDAIPIGARLSRLRFGRDITDGTEWLAALAGLSKKRAPASRVAEQALAAFTRTFGRVADPTALRRAQGMLEELGELPEVCEHRDFSPWNVCRTATDGGLAVFDWESSELRGVPGPDLVYFLAHMAFYLDGSMGREPARYIASYRRMLDSRTFTGRAAVEAARRYAAALGLEERSWRALRALTWLIHAPSDHAHLAADAGGEPTIAALRSSVFLALWEEEMRMEGAAW